jgi:hypothetical protein
MSELVHCRTCNHQVSSKAETCPQCGEINPGVSNQELEERKQEAQISLPGCALTIYSLLAGTLILGLLELVGIKLEAFGALIMVMFALVVNIVNRLYFAKKKNTRKSNKEVENDKLESKSLFRLGCLVIPFLFFVAAPFISFLLKSAGLQFDEVVVIPVITIILVLVYKVVQKKSR